MNRLNFNRKLISVGLISSVFAISLYKSENIRFYSDATIRLLTLGYVITPIIIDYKRNFPTQDVELQSQVHLRSAKLLLKGLLLNGGVYVKLVVIFLIR